MKRYRLLIRGQNFLINSDGKTQKCGFTQNMFIEADNPKQAETKVLVKMKFDQGLKALTLNTEDDPPKIALDTFWELDILDEVSGINEERVFYPEKKWWQFWR
jgi:hypothetical protein